MSENTEKRVPEKIRFLYHKPEDSELVYVNGVWGGMTPRGELVCYFFVEYADVPAEEKVSVVEGQLQPDKVSRVDRNEHAPTEAVIRRDIRVSLIIPAHEISSIANWMLDKLKSSKIIIEKEEG